MEDKETMTTTNEEMNINADADVPGNTHLSNEEEGAYNKMQDELDEQKDKYLRLVAEFENYKRRNAKERIEMVQTAGKDLIISLLEVMDDCERAEKQLNDEGTVVEREGIRLIFNKFKNTLQARGLKAMESINTDFDVEKHEAITGTEAGDEMKNKVVDVLEKGYYLNDKIIRFAKVVVGK